MLLNVASNHANWRIPGDSEGTATPDEADLSNSFCIVQEKAWNPETAGTFCLPFKQSLLGSVGVGRSDLPVTRPGNNKNEKNKTSHCDAETFQSPLRIKHFNLISSTLPQVCQMQGVSYLASPCLSKKQVTGSGDHYFGLRGCFFVHSSSVLTLLSLNWQFILYVSHVFREPWWNNTWPADSQWISSPQLPSMSV